MTGHASPVTCPSVAQPASVSPDIVGMRRQPRGSKSCAEPSLISSRLSDTPCTSDSNAAERRAKQKRYFHGGAPGRRKGERVVSPDESGQQSARLNLDPSDRSHIRTDRVFISEHRGDAKFFARTIPGGGAVYEVVPEGEVEPDPDCDGHACGWWQAPAAIVRRVLEERVKSATRDKIEVEQHTREQTLIRRVASRSAESTDNGEDAGRRLR